MSHSIHLFAIASEKITNHPHSVISAQGLGIGAGEHHQMLIFSGHPQRAAHVAALEGAGFHGKLVTALIAIPNNASPSHQMSDEVYVSAASPLKDSGIHTHFPHAQVHVMSSVDELQRQLPELKAFAREAASAGERAVGWGR